MSAHLIFRATVRSFRTNPGQAFRRGAVRDTSDHVAHGTLNRRALRQDSVVPRDINGGGCCGLMHTTQAADTALGQRLPRMGAVDLDGVEKPGIPRFPDGGD